MEELQTADLVRFELENDLFMIDYLKDELINTTAYARKILPKIKSRNKKATVESISIAVKRYIDNMNKKGIDKKLKKIISSSQIVVRDNICHVALERNFQNMGKINDISKKIRWDTDEIFLVNQGAGEITVIIDEKNSRLIVGRETRKNLALLTVKENNLEVKGIEVPGLYAYFITQLSRKAVNILEIISTNSQISFLIVEKDLSRSYEILKNAVDYCRL